MSRREGSFTFTFSRRNSDVRQILIEKKKSDPYFVTTDYICEAVRFYERNKDKININNQDSTQKMLEAFLKGMSLNANAIAQKNQEALNVQEEQKEKVPNILDTSKVSGLDDLDDSFIDED